MREGLGDPAPLLDEALPIEELRVELGRRTSDRP
jgi:hypothetical protein